MKSEYRTDYYVKLINDIYHLEKRFDYICKESDAHIGALHKLNERVEKLITKNPKDPEVIEIKKELEKFAEDVYNLNESIEKIKEGNTTLFDWKKLDEKSLELFDDLNAKPELKNNIKNKIYNNNHLIFAQINLNVTDTLLELTEKNENTPVIDELLEEKLSKVFIILNSPYNIKGKENAMFYIPQFPAQDDILVGCNVTDVISFELLKTSEEFDLEVLNNLKEENSLTKLYNLASGEVNQKSFNSKNKKRINDLTNSINKYFVKKNME